jgi:hypothetical protein
MIRAQLPDSHSRSVCRAGDGIRTRDLLITNQLLYQLSYASDDTKKTTARQRSFIPDATAIEKWRQVRDTCARLSFRVYKYTIFSLIVNGISPFLAEMAGS